MMHKIHLITGVLAGVAIAFLTLGYLGDIFNGHEVIAGIVAIVAGFVIVDRVEGEQ